MLALLLLGDAIFIFIHIQLGLAKDLHHNVLSLGHEHGIPECYQYLKWMLSAFACAYLYEQRQKPLYLAWAVVFTYLFIDDSAEFHEQVGRALRDGFGLTPGLFHRAQNMGEALAAAMIVPALLGMVVMAYLRTDDLAARWFTWRMVPGLGLLFVGGICFDLAGAKLLHFLSSISGYSLPWLAIGVFEDGGEMIGASFLAANALTQALAVRRLTTHKAAAVTPADYSLQPLPQRISSW